MGARFSWAYRYLLRRSGCRARTVFFFFSPGPAAMRNGRMVEFALGVIHAR